jgi:hypothetical protein
VCRLWNIGARSVALWTALVTAAATAIALTYDFFPVHEEDPNRPGFYVAALSTWGAQLLVYYLAYRALDDHNKAETQAHDLERVGHE